MFRNLCMLRRSILMSRTVCATYNCPIRANFFNNAKSLSKSVDSPNASDISVSDINICDMARGDVEFARNFLTSVPTLNGAMSAVSIATNSFSSEPAVGTDSKIQPEVDSGSGDASIGSSETTILDKDGMPIVPIEIDGWNNAADDEEGPTVQNASHLEIGNDNEYKTENLLVVPEKREGSFEYKGIKVKLPVRAHKDVGTYRFRRDAEDLETVGDDMRLVKFDKK